MGGGYFEVEYRTPDASFTATGSNQSLVNDIWAWPPSGYDTEWDFIELQHNPVYAYSACHSGDNCQTFPAWGYGISYDQYHTFASRFTTDGTNMVDCAYLDGTFQSCNGGNGAFQTSTGTSEERVFFRMTLGPQTTSGYSGNPPLNNMDMYVAHVRFWTCSSWLTTPCLSTVLTGAP